VRHLAKYVVEISLIRILDNRPYSFRYHLVIFLMPLTFHLGQVVVGGLDLVGHKVPGGWCWRESTADQRQDEECADGKVFHGECLNFD